MDILYLAFATLVFVAVVLLVEGAYLAWSTARGPEAGRLARRLRMMSAAGHGGEQSVSIAKKRMLSDLPALQRFLLGVPRVSVLDRFLVQSGKKWSVATFLAITATVFMGVFCATAYFAAPAWLRLIVAAIAASFPSQWVARAGRQRLARIEAQLPDALDLMSRALRAGHAFPTALRMVGEEMNDPLAGEFNTACDEVNFGIAMQDALMNLATRVPSTDLRYFVIAVMIQRETGGNLSELLDSISAIIRDRIKLLGQVKVLSAEGRLSAWILSLLPFCAALIIQLSNPKFLAVLFTDTGGQKMLGIALAMMLIGIVVMRNIIRIRV